MRLHGPRGSPPRSSTRDLTIVARVPNLRTPRSPLAVPIGTRAAPFVADPARLLAWDDLFDDGPGCSTSIAGLPFDFSADFAQSILRIERLPVPYLNVFHTHTRFDIIG